MNKIQFAPVNNTLHIGIGDLDYFEEMTELEDLRICGGATFDSVLRHQNASQEQSNAFTNQLKAKEIEGNQLRASIQKASNGR